MVGQDNIRNFESARFQILSADIGKVRQHEYPVIITYYKPIFPTCRSVCDMLMGQLLQDIDDAPSMPEVNA